MFKKDKIFRYSIIGVILVITAIVLVIAFLPKSDPLTIAAKDVTVDVDQTFSISYTVSDPYADITFKVLDEELIEVVDENEFKALKTSSTYIQVTATDSSKNSTSCYCSVNIINSNSSNPADDPTEEDPKEDEPGKDDEEKENLFEIMVSEGARYDKEEKTLYVTKNVDGIFSVTLLTADVQDSSSIKFVCSSNITITALTRPRGSYSITAEENGTVEVYVDETVCLGKFKVEFEEE